MCRSANDPGGPVRCTSHMKKALTESGARYASAYERFTSADLALKEAQAHLESTYELASQVEEIDYLDSAHALVAQAKAERADAYQAMMRRRELLRTAQLNYDATIGGIQDLSGLSIAAYDKLRELEGGGTPEDIEQARLECERLNRRIEVAKNNINKRNAGAFSKRAGEGEDITATPIRGEQGQTLDGLMGDAALAEEALGTQEMDGLIDEVISREQIGGVNTITTGLVDPETGQEYSRHDIRLASRRRNAELRTQIMAEGEAQGDTRVIIRQALRLAIYRGMFMSRATRRIIRLIGFSGYNRIMDSMEGKVIEKFTERYERQHRRWVAKREDMANAEERELRSSLAKVERRIAETQVLLDSEEGTERKAVLAERMRNLRHEKLGYDMGLNSIQHARLEWRAEQLAQRRLSEQEKDDLIARINSVNPEREEQLDPLIADYLRAAAG